MDKPSESSTCISCGSTFLENYCQHCGQKLINDRITVKRSLQQFWATMFNVDKGLWFTIKGLFVNPRAVFNQYISGGTNRYVHPFRFAIILITVQTFLLVSSGLYRNIQVNFSVMMEQEVNPLQGILMAFVNSHMHLLIAASIPALAFGSRLFFGSKKYNFAEHLVIQSFAYGQVVFIGILTFPIQYYLQGESMLFQFVSAGFTIVYLTYAYFSVFKQNVLLVLLKTIFSFVFWVIGLVLITGVSSFIYMYFLYQTNPALFESLKQS